MQKIGFEAVKAKNKEMKSFGMFNCAFCEHHKIDIRPVIIQEAIQQVIQQYLFDMLGKYVGKKTR